jgi:hypothetical protein
MKPSPRKYAILGALIVLAACILYLMFGRLDIFGIPDTRWAYNLFLPGIWAGKQTHELLHADQRICQAVGVLTMTLIGAALGWVIGWLLRAFTSKR